MSASKCIYDVSNTTQLITNYISPATLKPLRQQDTLREFTLSTADQTLTTKRVSEAVNSAKRHKQCSSPARGFFAKMSPHVETNLMQFNPEQVNCNNGAKSDIISQDRTTLLASNVKDATTSTMNDDGVNADHEKNVGGDLVTCEECNKLVFVWNLPEHKDYHFANLLQHEEQSLLQTSDNSNKSTVVKRNSVISRPTSKKLSLNITSYFNKN